MEKTSVRSDYQNREEYDAFLGRLDRRLASHGTAPLFQTDAADAVWDAYLAAFGDVVERQYHNCSACRHFLRRYGALAVVGEAGVLSSALWGWQGDAPEAYGAAVAAMARLVERAKITGVFLSKEKMLGTRETGPWHHLSVKNCRPHKSATVLPHQAAAEKATEFATVSRALSEFDAKTLDQVVALLEADAVYRGEKVLGPAKWLRDLQAEAKGPGKRNVIWKAVATAPAGFCHPRSSMIGTLLEDLERGMDFDEAAGRFKAKMHPLMYQRPQAAPSDAQIEAAEKAVEALGAAGALERRFARGEDVLETLWRAGAAPERGETGGVFGHLKERGKQKPLESTDGIKVSWEKFAAEVLPGAAALAVMVPFRGPFYGLLTAANPDAPPILQWDREERRNPVSWYFYHNESHASQWGLTHGEWADVPLVMPCPAHWFGFKGTHYPPMAMLVIPAARDSREGGLGLFPEILKPELHGVRRVIEAHSQQGRPSGREEGNVNGLAVQKGGGGGVRLRVSLPSGARVTYTIDRW